MRTVGRKVPWTIKEKNNWKLMVVSFLPGIVDPLQLIPIAEILLEKHNVSNCYLNLIKQQIPFPTVQGSSTHQVKITANQSVSQRACPPSNNLSTKRRRCQLGNPPQGRSSTSTPHSLFAPR